MNIELNLKMIEDMCGAVSFNRGDSFYRSNKVMFESYEPDECKAIVKGVEDFQVIINRNEDRSFVPNCSCPTLDSFKWQCQHIAAVLLSIHDHQRQGITPIVPNKITENILSLFDNHPVRASGEQLRFEKRKVLNIELICKPIRTINGQFLIGIEMNVESFPVKNIREFLEYIKSGLPYLLSDTFKYVPTEHCFSKDTNVIIQQLIQVIHDEKIYADTIFTHQGNTEENQIVFSPSSWDRVVPLLSRSSKVKIKYNDQSFIGFHISKDSLPLQFEFFESGGYQLKIEGLDDIIVLDSYGTLFSEGKFIPLEKKDCHRLLELKQMLAASGTNQLSIPQNQIGYFIEKVVPNLNRLGTVHLSKELSKQFDDIKLTAKLYLDRVKNKLLVGIEFHYGNIMINPLEERTSPVLLRDLEKENEILTVMEESSFNKTDGGYYLHNEELEYEFLYNVVPKLQKIVQIYATTAVRNRIFRGNTSPKIRVKAQKERTNWLEFKFELDGIPEKQIRDVLLALEEKRKYYRLRNGALLSLETSEFKEIKRFMNAIPTEDMDLGNGFKLPMIKGLHLLDSIDDERILQLENSFSQLLNDIRNPSNLNFVIPKSIESVLRDYQREGYKWMKSLASYGFGGILADDMGLGKTLQSITFILSELANIRKRKLPVLIVCPSSLVYNWKNELNKFAPEVRIVIIDGNKTERTKRSKELTNTDVVIISYPLLRKDINVYEKLVFHTVFFDEAQAFKNYTTQTARSAKKIQAENRFALTGTPVENSLEELWSIFHIVFPELFLGLKEYSNLSRKKISRRIRPFLLRRLKEDVLKELPEKLESMETVELLPEQKKLYAAYLAKLRHDTLKHLDKATLRKNRIKILAGLTRLRQICCHPSLFVDGYKGSSAKYEQLLQIVNESKLSGRRVLIFSQFTKMLELIGKELAHQGLPFFYLDGQTPSEERVGICNRFNAGERDLFLISLKAGGTGLNLTGADTVILYDTWWNPAVEEQAADRAYRIGQVNEVQVIKLVASGTIEEKMNELQEKKRHLIEEVIDSDEKAASVLTEEDIREILMI